MGYCEEFKILLILVNVYCLCFKNKAELSTMLRNRHLKKEERVKKSNILK